jgi:peptide-methionine (S)-S-oxide reductase
VPGVIRTRVGYTGGTKKNPTYYRLGDHTESIQIDFDPQVISYEELLGLFWRSHDPTRQAWSVQYKAAVYYHDDNQKRLAELTRDREANRLEQRIHTDIEPAGTFYRAEDYHQKYYLRQHGALFGAYQRIYPEIDDLVDSTAVTRLNGYVGGYGTKELLRSEADLLGLDPEVAKKLEANLASAEDLKSKAR